MAAYMRGRLASRCRMKPITPARFSFTVPLRRIYHYIYQWRASERASESPQPIPIQNSSHFSPSLVFHATATIRRNLTRKQISCISLPSAASRTRHASPFFQLSFRPLFPTCMHMLHNARDVPAEDVVRPTRAITAAALSHARVTP